VACSISGYEKEKAGCMESGGSGIQGLSRSPLSNTVPLLNKIKREDIK
jgi:hypothetical protein